MKLSIFKWMILTLLFVGSLQAQEKNEYDARYQKRVDKYITRWEKMIPRYTKLQFAGPNYGGLFPAVHPFPSGCDNSSNLFPAT